ncbi:DNA recombination and repair protein RecA-like ATP-binding domain [Arabidopsis thaliana x Arabidopsis arenosa]|uniref:DNA recombination and repair protein RecA-like ATP-binding domain n=2 Tax=Arabidopsis TaxID=3701 RepID=A0A8T2DI10_ARASU|nr:DNA recombination and repair protein RecA-like ATP-binding domain [Arabidopsis thaliana x Arabidopsis arenosa]KAG7611735.1 DNA recombination and repair protein RecA-like ATP-binding domain [Arabidopsis suecica]
MWRLDLRSFKVPGSGKKAVRSRELYEFDVEDDDVDDDEEDIRGSEKKTRRDGYEVVYASGEKKRSKVDHVNITEEEAFEILRLANQSSGSSSCNGSRSLINGAKNAWDMLHEEESLPRITTSCSDLDSILGGGISCRDVTEH